MKSYTIAPINRPILAYASTAAIVLGFLAAALVLLAMALAAGAVAPFFTATVLVGA